ncbi:MAG: helix-turn-helix domain-containing protein [Xanthobacteraceae bacterium]
MPAVAIYTADSSLRSRLERCVREQPGVALLGATASPQTLSQWIERDRVDAVLADAPQREQLNDWLVRHPGTAFIVLIGETDEGGLDALGAGAKAIIPRSASPAEILASIAAATNGLVVLPPGLLETFLAEKSPDPDTLPTRDAEGRPLLTKRELEVLAAMADGASNKAIARRLGISFHTVKFHVAAILGKLDADSRTEAVAKAAHLGLVML